MEEQSFEPSPWTQLTARAQHLARHARRFVHDRPLQAIALTIGVGFVVGKLLSGRDAA